MILSRSELTKAAISRTLTIMNFLERLFFCWLNSSFDFFPSNISLVAQDYRLAALFLSLRFDSGNHYTKNISDPKNQSVMFSLERLLPSWRIGFIYAKHAAVGKKVLLTFVIKKSAKDVTLNICRRTVYFSFARTKSHSKWFWINHFRWSFYYLQADLSWKWAAARDLADYLGGFLIVQWKLSWADTDRRAILSALDGCP